MLCCAAVLMCSSVSGELPAAGEHQQLRHEDDEHVRCASRGQDCHGGSGWYTFPPSECEGQSLSISLILFCCIREIWSEKIKKTSGASSKCLIKIVMPIPKNKPTQLILTVKHWYSPSVHLCCHVCLFVCAAAVGIIITLVVINSISITGMSHCSLMSREGGGSPGVY